MNNNHKRLRGNAATKGREEGGQYPKLALTPAPRHMAQLLVLRRGKVLLGRHVSGEFEGRWTGFIEEVKVREEDKKKMLFRCVVFPSSHLCLLVYCIVRVGGFHSIFSSSYDMITILCELRVQYVISS